jgi:hypothetical protein
MNARTTDELAGRFLFHLTLQFMIEASIHAGEVLYLAGSATEKSRRAIHHVEISLLMSPFLKS